METLKTKTFFRFLTSFRSKYLAGIFITLTVGLFVYAFVSFNSSLTTGADGYYHAAEARAKLTGQPILMPVYSTLSTKPSDLYLGYHSLLSLFINTDDSYQETLDKLEIAHVFFAMYVMFLIYLICIDLTKNQYASLFGCIAGMASYLLIFRLSFLRPESVIIFFLASFSWALYREKKKLAFILMLVFPLVYSIFVVLWAVFFTYAVTLLIKDGWNGIKSTLKTGPLLLLANAIGIILHPNALNYLYNGVFVHLKVLLGGSIAMPEGSELDNLYIGISFESVWVLLLLILVSVYVLYVYKNGIKTLPKDSLFFGLLSVFFFFMYYSALRFGSYFHPIFMIWLALAVRDSNDIISYFKPLFSKAILFTFGVLFSFNVFHFYFIRSLPLPVDYSKNTAEYLEGKDGVVFLRSFGFYPNMIFFNQDARLSNGFGNIFMYMYSTTTAGIYKDISTRKVPVSVGAKSLGILYIFDDGTSPIYSEALASDPCLSLIFTDSKYPLVKLFEVDNDCTAWNKVKSFQLDT